MAPVSRRRRRQIATVAQAVIFASLSDVVSAESWQPALSDSYIAVRDKNISEMSQVRSGPFHPSGIVDPFSDVNCPDQGKACSEHEQCSDFPLRLCEPYQKCAAQGYPKVCLHKNLWPMLNEDLWLFVGMFGIAVCAGAAGIGGGGLNVPILMMINSFGIKEAVPLSHAAVMGNAFAQLIVNAPQRHPSAPQRPLIHYELALLVLPAQLGGNSLGVVIGRIFPPTLLIVLSLAMLALAATKTFLKGRHVWHEFKEKKRPAIQQAAVSSPATPAAQKGLPSSPAGQPSSPTVPREGSMGGNPVAPLSPSPISMRRDSTTSNSSRMSAVSQDLRLPTTARDVQCVRTWSGTNLLPANTLIDVAYRNDNVATPAEGVPAADAEVPMRIPWQVVGVMVIFNIVFCIDFLVMSPDVFGVKKCTAVYWVALLGLYPFVVASIWVGIKSLRRLAAYHEHRGDPPVAGDPEVNARLIVLFPLAAVLIGLIAGLVGLGGGEFMVPLLLEFGLLPRVASATSGFLILFATSSNIVHYLIANTMEPFILYGVGVFILAFLGALLGLAIRDTKYMREHNYLLVFLLAFLLTVSGGLLAYRGFAMSSPDWGFAPFCPT